MDKSALSRARQLLGQAAALRDQIREDLRLRRFGADDLRMDAHNDLVNMGAYLFPDDPVLKNMILMPDANLKFRIQFAPGTLPDDVATRRLEARLNQFISRLELVLGESVPQSKSSPTAREVLAAERSQEIRAVLDDIEALLQKKPQLPQLSALSFEFVGSDDLRQLLKKDYEEAQRAMIAGAFKASSLLAGGLIEGMLLDKLQQPDIVSGTGYDQAVADFPRAGSDINWDYVGLEKLIRTAGELGLLTESALRLARGARDFRNTIHPYAELREGVRAKREEAKLLLAVVELIYRDLAK